MDTFQQAIEDAADLLQSLPKEEPVVIVSHTDADGIAACAIMGAALRRLGQRHEIRLVPQLTTMEVDRLATHGRCIFVDIGTSHAQQIEQLFGAQALIIDHHQTAGDALDVERLNPCRYGMDGSRDACSSTIAYLLAVALDEQNRELAGLALVGIVADAQEKLGLQGLNKEVVDEGIADGVISAEERLRLFGYERKSLVSMLIGSHDLRIPGVTGNPHGARKFLESLGLPLRDRYDRETRYGDLTEEQQRILFDEGIKAATKTPATALHFTLPKERGMFRDARQYATLLNACGRLEQAQLGLAICRGELEARSRSTKLLGEYQEALHAAYEWQQHAQERVIRTERYLLIDAQRDILPSLIGTVCSMNARGGDLPKGTFVLGLARYADGEQTKVSMRVAGYEKSDLNHLLEQMMEGVRGESGGHSQAAGAIIATEDEAIFIENAKRVLGEV
jgi:single-stranded-DNA-specific exonuclease